MQKTNRTLKVYGTPNGAHSKIILQGKWLTEIGFSIGDYIEVNQKGNQVTITKVKPPIEDKKVAFKTKVSKQQLLLVRERAVRYQVDEQTVINKALQYYFTKKKGL